MLIFCNSPKDWVQNQMKEKENFCFEASALNFDFSDVDTQYSQISQLYKKAMPSMQKLLDGELVNSEEGRMVGHYWLRNTSLSPRADIQKYIDGNFKKIEEFSSAIHSGELLSSKKSPFTRFIQVGIGGSILGTQLLAKIFPKHRIKGDFIDNSDIETLEEKFFSLDEKELESTLFLIISKSGETSEVLYVVSALQDFFDSKNLSFASQAVSITMESSLLDEKAKREKWLERFHLQDWIGGRTSITSISSLLPAALMGIEIQKFLEGAKQMDICCREEKKNPALFLTQMLLSQKERERRNIVILPYRDSLSLFGKYLQQLIMESLGKEKNKEGKRVQEGFSVYGNKGTSDQHSYLQLLQEGVEDFFVIFIQTCTENKFLSNPCRRQVEDFLQGSLYGTRSSLASNGKKSILISLKKVTPFSIGALISVFENTVSFYAFIQKINAYHQPGVEKGKKSAEDFVQTLQQLRQIPKEKEWTIPEIQKKVETKSFETVKNCLEYLKQNEELEVLFIQNEKRVIFL